MPKKSIIESLPQEFREKLNKKLIDAGFQHYQALSDWLAAEGYQISKSTLHRYGQHFEKNLESLRVFTEQAKIIAAEIGDENNDLGDALTRLMQQRAYQALLELEDPGEISLTSLARAIADINRSSVTVKKYRAETMRKLNEKLDKMELQSNQLSSQELLQKIRQEVYGIF